MVKRSEGVLEFNGFKKGEKYSYNGRAVKIRKFCFLKNCKEICIVDFNEENGFLKWLSLDEANDLLTKSNQLQHRD